MPWDSSPSSSAELAYSPKRAMAELRHSSSVGARASSSPMKRDEDASPLIHGTTHDDDHRHHFSRDRDRSFWSFLSDDPRVFSLLNSKISLFLVAVFAIVGLISAFSIFNRLVGFWISILKFVCISLLKKSHYYFFSLSL